MKERRERETSVLFLIWISRGGFKNTFPAISENTNPKCMPGELSPSWSSWLRQLDSCMGWVFRTTRSASNHPKSWTKPTGYYFTKLSESLTHYVCWKPPQLLLLIGPFRVIVEIMVPDRGCRVRCAPIWIGTSSPSLIFRNLSEVNASIMDHTEHGDYRAKSALFEDVLALQHYHGGF